MSNRLSMLFFVVFVSCLEVSGQGNLVKELKIGDVVPDVSIGNIINGEKTSLKMSELKNKVVILDFWTTWCAPCIAAFPKMDALQKKFKDKLQIIPVTYEKKSLVANFTNKYKASQGLLPMSATEDTILRRMFPHNSFPHYVIINSASRVAAITSGDNITEEKLIMLIEGKVPEFFVKDDGAGFWIEEKDARVFSPVVKKHDGNSSDFEMIGNEKVLIQSVLTEYVEGLWPGGKNRPGFISARNMSPRMLYGTAMARGGMPLLLDIESNDTALWKKIAARLPGDSIYMNTLEEKKEWIRQHTYMYELKVPASLDSIKYDIMIEELNRAFGPALGIRCDVERKLSKYLALVLEDSIKLKTKSAEMKNVNPEESNKFSAILSNEFLSRFIGQVMTTLQKYHPIEDETGYVTRVNLRIDANLYDLDDVNKKLADYGLRFVQKKKLMNTGVIRPIK